MEEELPVDPGNKGWQATNKDNTNNSCSPVADGDLTIPSKKTINAPPFNSFLVLEVYLLTSCSWFKLTPNSSPIVKKESFVSLCVNLPFRCQKNIKLMIHRVIAILLRCLPSLPLRMR